MELFLRLIEWDLPSNSEVWGQVVPCPADVTPENLGSYLTQVYGTPLDVVRTTTDQFDRILIGWLYPLEVLKKIDPEAEPGWELWVIPMVRREEGGYYSLFVAQAEQQAWMRRAWADGRLKDYVDVTVPPTDYVPTHDPGSAPESR